MLRFFRNPEIQRFAVMLAVLTACVTLTGFLFGTGTGIGVMACALLFTSVFLLFQRKKYGQIETLSAYLRRITAGEYDLDIRDNREGELSILKSEIYKVTAMLSEYNKKLERDKEKLAETMSDISHQLKTPITSMTVMVDLLGDESLPDEKRGQFTSQLIAQLDRLQWLVSSLLKFSRLDVGAVTMRREQVNVKQLIEKAAAPVLIPAELKEQTLVFEGSDTDGLIGDMGWTAEAILNVLKNCVEHTPAGGRVCVKWTSNPIYTEILISDNGEGIDAKDIPNIFTRFYRGKNAGEDSVGIGLAMAKSILEQQGGDISAKSSPKGTVFAIRFYKSVI